MKDGKELAHKYLEEKGILIDGVHDGVYDISDNPFQCLSTSLCESEAEREEVRTDRIKNHLDYYRRIGYDEDQLAAAAKVIKLSILLVSEFTAALDGIIAACQENTCYIGQAYERYDEFLFAHPPKKAEYTQFGDGFEGHGTAVVLQFEQPPKAIMILGQND